MATDPYAPEIAYTSTRRVACDGGSEVAPGLGHPRVFMQIDERGYGECGYCDKRFVLEGGPADDRAKG